MEKEKEFEQIVKKHKSTIYTVCYMFSKDEDEVNDLFQETLLNLWKGFDGFRGDAAVSSWIWKVALNTCISFDRKKKRQGEKIPLGWRTSATTKSPPLSASVSRM